MLKRIKYVSHFARSLGAREIDDIALISQKNNFESGITGVLMTSGGLFFQILEGPAAAVDRLFEVISNDPRHKDILLLSTESNVRRRLFPDYSMKTISLRASTEDRLAPIHALLEAVVRPAEVDRPAGGDARAEHLAGVRLGLGAQRIGRRQLRRGVAVAGSTSNAEANASATAQPSSVAASRPPS